VALPLAPATSTIAGNTVTGGGQGAGIEVGAGGALSVTRSTLTNMESLERAIRGAYDLGALASADAALVSR
jgi:hypothetical protein